MTQTVLVAGTASHVGKSTVAAGLCRLLADRGVDVAPFKAQNMSNNARAVPGGEIGVSQYVQARAARIPASVDHNPVLLKPRGEGESQLILRGEAVGHYSAGTYYEAHWDEALAAAEAAHERLAADHDVIVAEGAGSVAEPNLRERDLANVETARFADADVLLVADIERGGAFASLVGSLELTPPAVRDRVAGALLTKFRGDREILAPAIEEFEERTGVPLLGVVPHDDPGLPAEDSVDLPPEGETAVRGGDDGVSDEQAVTVAVPRLPRISNFTDLEPLAREPGVRVAYRPIDADLADADALVLPGTKNTVDDLVALREAGMADRIAAFEGPVVGLCGGYQLLGERISNVTLEGTGERDAYEGTGERNAYEGTGDDAAVDGNDHGTPDGSGEATLDGIGLLPVATRFEADKRVKPVERTLEGVGPLAGAGGTVRGYEIHMGRTELLEPVARPFPDEGVATDRVLGTYLHGLFENRVARRAFVETVFEIAGLEPPAEPGAGDEPASPYDRAADLLGAHADLWPLGLPD